MPFVRSKAALALGNLGPDAREAVPALVKLLKGQPLDYSVVAALGNLGPTAADAVPALKRLLRGNLSGDNRAKVESAVKKIRAKSVEGE